MMLGADIFPQLFFIDYFRLNHQFIIKIYCMLVREVTDKQINR